MATDRNDRVAEVVARERSRLRRFIGRRVSDAAEAEDILQDVLSKLVEANSLLMPIDHLTAWLFRAARNRIVDWFRKKRPETLDDLDDVLPPIEDGPDAAYAADLLTDALAAAIADLPKEQRDALVQHEIEGRSFEQMAAESGVKVSTLLARKRYALLRLRARLQGLYDEFTNA